MSDFCIRISGIVAQGRHGANPGERDFPQDFVVDLDVTVDVGDDTLESTADYGVLIDAAREVIERDSYELLETLADQIGKAVFQYQNVVQVVATVHKPGAAIALGVGDISAEAIVR